MVMTTASVNTVDGREAFCIITSDGLYFVAADTMQDAKSYVEEHLITRDDVIYGVRHTVDVYIV